MKKITIRLLSLFAVCTFSSQAHADQLVQSFKDPSFSGNGWTTQVLSVRQMEETHASDNASALASAQASAASAAASTPLAKFINLFESQVYAQLATQLSNNLFATGNGTSNTGTFNLAGNTISYVKTDSNVTLTVVDSSGNQTVVTVPIATFSF